MVYVFLAPGFEEGEAIVPIDLMLRAGISVTTVGIGSQIIQGAHGIAVTADVAESQLTSLPEDAEMILLPGGMPGTKNLDASPFVHACIRSASERNLPLAAICAAPSVYGKLGLLRGKKATCFPGFEEALLSADVTGEGVAADENVITARALGSAYEFAFAIIERLKDAETAIRVRDSIYFKP